MSKAEMIIDDLKEDIKLLKKQQGQLQRIKEICNKHINDYCINCPLEFKAIYPARTRTFCILDDAPNMWDIKFILEKLDERN